MNWKRSIQYLDEFKEYRNIDFFMSILRANILYILIETYEWKTYLTVYKLVKKNYVKNKYIKIKIVFFKYSVGSIGEICSKRKNIL